MLVRKVRLMKLSPPILLLLELLPILSLTLLSGRFPWLLSVVFVLSIILPLVLFPTKLSAFRAAFYNAVLYAIGVLRTFWTGPMQVHPLAPLAEGIFLFVLFCLLVTGMCFTNHCLYKWFHKTNKKQRKV